jgi:RNA polymerase sigma-70 factor (ECF subfamily)
MDSWAMVSDCELVTGPGEMAERFGVLFDRHFPAIHRYLQRRAGRRVANDLAVENVPGSVSPA